MLEQLIMSALGRKPELIRSVIQEELLRLQRGGYLDPAEVERLGKQALEALSTHIADAQQATAPIALGAAATIRDLLDVPSRDEVREMLRPEASGGAGGE